MRWRQTYMLWRCSWNNEEIMQRSLFIVAVTAMVVGSFQVHPIALRLPGGADGLTRVVHPLEGNRYVVQKGHPDRDDLASRSWPFHPWHISDQRGEDLPLTLATSPAPLGLVFRWFRTNERSCTSACTVYPLLQLLCIYLL